MSFLRLMLSQPSLKMKNISFHWKLFHQYNLTLVRWYSWDHWQASQLSDVDHYCCAVHIPNNQSEISIVLWRPIRDQCSFVSTNQNEYLPQDKSGQSCRNCSCRIRCCLSCCSQESEHSTHAETVWSAQTNHPSPGEIFHQQIFFIVKCFFTFSGFLDLGGSDQDGVRSRSLSWWPSSLWYIWATNQWLVLIVLTNHKMMLPHQRREMHWTLVWLHPQHCCCCCWAVIQ